MKKERMTATMKERNLDTTAPDLSGARVVVAGLGRSGLAVARFLASRGARVHASDVRPVSELEEEAAAIDAMGAGVETGGHVPERFAESDLVVVSPGVPLAVPALAAARNAGVPIWAEVELAARFLRGPLIGVTGSNGKSTVVSLIAHLLEAAGREAVACGNLGTPLISLVEDDRESRWYVVELSSFQLEGIRSLRPHIAVVTNLTPDHQDRYPSLAEYGEAKARIFRNQDGADHAILNADDPLVATMGDRHGGPRRWLFSGSGRAGAAAVLRDGRLLLVDPGTVLLDAAELPIAGRHNVENALAASLAASLAGAGAGALAAGLRSFRGLPHRMEVVGEAAGVVWYNDSKATNLGATR
ncbi:MAG: UDP-N-acetylmuramoyl-L-alanine--D-glutamate ligase, partial [Acidobacteriota bacterium]